MSSMFWGGKDRKVKWEGIALDSSSTAKPAYNDTLNLKADTLNLMSIP